MHSLKGTPLVLGLATALGLHSSPAAALDLDIKLGGDPDVSASALGLDANVDLDLGGSPDVEANLGGLNAGVDLGNHGGSGHGTGLGVDVGLGGSGSGGGSGGGGTGSGGGGMPGTGGPETGGPGTFASQDAGPGGFTGTGLPPLAQLFGWTVYSSDGHILGRVTSAEMVGGRYDVMVRINPALGVSADLVKMRLTSLSGDGGMVRTGISLQQFLAPLT